MIIQKENEPRIEYLARVLKRFMEKHHYAAELTISYDGVECDGWCLAEDFCNELSLYDD